MAGDGRAFGATQHEVAPRTRVEKVHEGFVRGPVVLLHEALEGAQAQLSEQEAALSVEDTRAIQVSVATSVKPARVPLEFCNPYAFRGAWLLARYDAFACAVLTARPWRAPHDKGAHLRAFHKTRS